MHSGICSGIVEFDLGANTTHVWRAVQPDNLTAPPHVRVDCIPEGSRLRCSVEVVGCEDPRRVLTFRNTIDDLILAVRTALDAIEAARR